MIREVAAKLLVALAALGLLAAGPVAAQADIVAVIEQNPELSTFAKAIKATGMEASLKSEGPFTVFVPNNAAFAKLPPDVLAEMMKPGNADAMISLLAYHVAFGALSSREMTGGKQTIETVDGQKLEIDGTSGLKVGGATIVSPDQSAQNGVIHIIDEVLAPE